jgi:phage terminase large subunit
VAAHVFQIGKHKKFEIWCRGLDKPRSCEGINAIGYWGDEWELTKYESFIPALQRVRVGPCLTTILTGTPEGFNKNYKAILQPDNRLATTREYILSTRDNPFLPPNYYEDSKKRLMTTEAILEKLEGIRTPKGGRVYSRFNKENNAMTLRSMARFQRTRYAIACDFNVNYMHFLILEIDEQLKAIKVIDEVIHEGGTTTDQHVRRTMDRLIQITGKSYDELVRMRIRAYCDSYGSARSAVTEKSNFTLVQHGGFVVDAPSKNPPVEDRINAVQCLFRDQRLYIAPNCQTLITNFETQTYDEKTGEPDKKNNIDHGIDGVGYAVARLYPVAVRKPRDYTPEKYESDEWGIL